jgi:hypothetical protein
MAKVTISLDDSRPEIIALFGENALETVADDMGYMTTVPNPDYVPAQGNETMQDPDWVMPDDFEPLTDTIPQIPNPNYVAQVGEATMPNPISKADFVARQILRNRIIPALIERFEQRRKREADALLKAQITQVATVLESVAEVSVE